MRENLARSYKFENCSSWGDLCRIHKLNEFCCQNTIHNIIEFFINIGKVHKIFELFTKYWNNSQNIGMIHKILESFTKYWNDLQSKYS